MRNARTNERKSKNWNLPKVCDICVHFDWQTGTWTKKAKLGKKESEKRVTMWMKRAIVVSKRKS